MSKSPDSTKTRFANKLQQLAESEGFEDPMKLIEEFHIDSVVPGICMTSGCDYSTGVEPDCTDGWCEDCGEGTVRSCLILGGVI